MTQLDKVKEYMSLCGITTKKELKTLGNFYASEQFLGTLLNGSYPLDEKSLKDLYRAINVTRAKKLMNYDKSQDENS